MPRQANIDSIDDLAMQADIIFHATKSLCATGMIKYVGGQDSYNQLKGVMNEIQSRIQDSPAVHMVNNGYYSPDAISKRLKKDKTFKSFETMHEAINYYHGLLQ